jgi:hypothetical protein
MEGFNESDAAWIELSQTTDLQHFLTCQTRASARICGDERRAHNGDGAVTFGKSDKACLTGEPSP